MRAVLVAKRSSRMIEKGSLLEQTLGVKIRNGLTSKEKWILVVFMAIIIRMLPEITGHESVIIIVSFVS